MPVLTKKLRWSQLRENHPICITYSMVSIVRLGRLRLIEFEIEIDDWLFDSFSFKKIGFFDFHVLRLS